MVFGNLHNRNIGLQKKKKKIIMSPLGALEPWSMSKKLKKLAFWLYQKNFKKKFCDAIHVTSEIENLNVKNLGIILKHSLYPMELIKLMKKKKVNKIKRQFFFQEFMKKVC